MPAKLFSPLLLVSCYFAPQRSAAKEHLLFGRENMRGENQVAENSGAGFSQSKLELRGAALYTRDLQQETRGGWAETGEAGARIAQGLRNAGALSREFFWLLPVW